MKAAQLKENLIDKDSKPFDVVVISKFQVSAPWLGISKAYDQMIQSMNSQGLNVCLVTEGEKFSSMVISPLLTVKKVPASTKRIKSLIKMPIPHPTSFWLSEIVEFLNLGAVVVAPIVGIQTAVFRIPKSGNQKFISTLHTPYSNWTPWGFIFQLIQKKTLSYSDIEVANSKTIVRRLKLKNSMKLRIIPHSSQFGKRFATDEPQLKKDPIWIGTLTHRKGVNRLALLVFLIRKKTKLRIIWSSSKFDLFWRLVLKKFAKFGWCELEQNLTEDELSAALANASCLISTTRFESFGLTIIEAARAKTGVIGIRAPGVTETLPESTGGAIYFTNVREVSKYLHGKSSVSEFENLGNNAASYVETTYDFDKISKLWSQILCD